MGLFHRIKHEYAVYKNARKNPDPLASSISETLAFVIDENVVEIMYCQPRLAAILLSEPKVVRVSVEHGENVGLHWKYIDGQFIDPKTIKVTYPHEKK